MHIALINPKTFVVENVVVPPGMIEHNGVLKPTVWFAPDGFIAVETETARIGDIYDPKTETFTTPQQAEE